FFFHSSATHLHLHSFPTRRSSDLSGKDAYFSVSSVIAFITLDESKNSIGCPKNNPITKPIPIIHIGPAMKSLTRFQARILESGRDRKSTRLNSSHDQISYAVFCLK